MLEKIKTPMGAYPFFYGKAIKRVVIFVTDKLLLILGFISQNLISVYAAESINIDVECL